MNVADRAVQAYEARAAAEAAEKEAATARQRALAIEAIGRKADVFGIGFDAVDLKEGYYNSWSLEVPVDDDASLVFNYRGADGVWVTVKPCDQLYWNLPPGQETKGPGGGTFQCFNLSRDRRIETLADLGKEIQHVRKARESWCKKHGVK